MSRSSRPGTSYLRTEIRSSALTAFWFWMIACAAALGFMAIAMLRHAEGWTAVLAIGAIGALGAALLSLRYRLAPEKLPVVASLQRVYNLTLEQVSTSLEQERAAAPPSTFTGVQVLPTWLWARNTGLALVIVKLDDIAWVYKKSTVNYRDGVKEGTAHELIVRTVSAPDRRIGLTTKSIEADQLIAYMAERAPWAFYGWDEQRLKGWSGAPGKQAIAEVVARRDAMKTRAQTS